MCWGVSNIYSGFSLPCTLKPTTSVAEMFPSLALLVEVISLLIYRHGCAAFTTQPSTSTSSPLQLRDCMFKSAPELRIASQGFLPPPLFCASYLLTSPSAICIVGCELQACYTY